MTRIVDCSLETEGIVAYRNKEVIKLLYFYMDCSHLNVTHAREKCIQFVGSHLLTSVGGIVVSIAAFQAVDPGSIPGHRRLFLWF